MEKITFSYRKTFLLGFGFFSISLLWSIYNSYIPIFLKEFSLSSLLVGFIMTFDNILAIVLQPYIGFLSDQTRTRFGRRMPFIMVGAPIAAVFFLLIPFAKSLNIGWMITTILIMNLAMAIFRAPVIALMPDTVPSQSRSKANGVVNFMGGLGALLAFLVGSKLYEINKSLPFIIGGVALVVSCLLVFVFVKEPIAETDDSSEKPSKKTAKIGFIERKERTLATSRHILVVLRLQRDRNLLHQLREIPPRNRREQSFLRLGPFLTDLYALLHSCRIYRDEIWQKKDNFSWYCHSFNNEWYHRSTDRFFTHTSDADLRGVRMGLYQHQLAAYGRRYGRTGKSRRPDGVILLLLDVGGGGGTTIRGAIDRPF